MKKKFIIGAMISGVFLFLALRDIDWNAFGTVFRDVDYASIALCVVVTMLGHFSRSIRWKYMLDPVKRVGISSLWSATAIAFMFNNLFPARLGEFVRAFAIGKAENIRKSSAFATIVYERVVDVFVLIVLLWACLLKVEGPEWLRRSGILLMVANGALLALLYLMFRCRERCNDVLLRLTRPLPERPRNRLLRWANSFSEGLGILADRSRILPVVLLSIPVWGFATLGVYYCLISIGMELPFFASVVLIVLTSLGSMIPSAPAYVGTMQYACIVGLAIYSVDKSEALAYSTLYHVTQFLPITIAGLYYAWRSRIHFSDVSRKEDA